jgi:hypothetical protein
LQETTYAQGETMPSWMQIPFAIVILVFLWYIAKQLDVIARAILRIEARFALMRPLPSEIEMQELLEGEASLRR